MSRLKDALMSLLGKCTPAGTKPDGNNVDEILECMAAHYNGGKTVFYGASNYLYVDKEMTEKATKQVVSDAFARGFVYLEIDGEGVYRIPKAVVVKDANAFAYISVINTDTSGTATTQMYHTVEWAQ